MPAIFISHSSLDAKVADDIKSTLARLGFDRVFLDFDKETGIGAGENWEKRLYEELSRCHAVILAITPNWSASKWCFAELQQARALGKLIFPIVCAPIGDRKVLTEIQAVDMLDWDSGGLQRLEQRLQAISSELARGFTLDPHRSPYPGIHAFEAEDAAIYFGRDDETRALIEKLDARRRQGGARFVVLVGASGSGKSSLLRAGLLPQLARRRGRWILLAPMRPEKAPLESLAKALADKCGEPQAWRSWHERLRGPDAIRHVNELVKDLRVGEAGAATLLIPIDQFEETFTIAEAAERDAFLALLAAMLDPVRDLPIIVVATGRADVLHGLLEGSELAPLTETVPLPKMPLERIVRLVEGPAGVAGLHIEKGLSDRIMRDVETSEALPLLAYTLRILHERGGQDRRLTLAEYHALGDPARGLNPVQNSVRLAADQAIVGLKPSEQELTALRDAFIPHLVRVRLDDGKRVRQPAPLAALPREAERLIRALTEARLLTVRIEDESATRAGDTIVEVTHEALFAAWPTLAGWLDDEQAFLVDVERIKGAHQTWTQTPDDQKPKALLHGLLLARARDWLVKYPQRFIGRDMEPLRAFIAASATAEEAEHARGERLRRRFVQAVASAAIVFAGAAAVASWQYFEAEKARRTSVFAEQVAKAAEAQAKTAEAAAIAERDRAQRNFGIAKQAADDVVFKLALDLRNVQGMRVEWIRRLLDTAQAMMDKLAEAAPDDLQLQRSRHAMFAAFVDAYLTAGDLGRARAASDESLAIMRRLIAAEPRNTNWLRELSLSLVKVGNVRVASGDRAGALAAYEESVAIMRRLVAINPQNARWQRDLSSSLNYVGDVRQAAGDRAGAVEAHEESLAVMRKLAAADPAGPDTQRALSVSLTNVGIVRLTGGNRAGALAAHEEALAIRRKLVAANPRNASMLRDVSVSLNNVGFVRLAGGDRAGALASYEESLAIRRRLAAADPGNAAWQRDVSTSLGNVGDVRRSAGDREGALAAYQESLDIRRKLVAADPNNTGWQRDVSASLISVGNVQLSTGDRERALASYEEALAIRRKLAAADPGNASWQRDVSSGLDRVGDVRLVAGDRAGALAVFEEALAIMRKLAATDPGNTGWVRDVSVYLDKVGDVYIAAGDRTGALPNFEESLAIRRKLAASDLVNTEWQRDVSVSLDRVGNVRRNVGDSAGALQAHEESLAIRRKLVVADPGNAGWQRDLTISLNNVGDVRRLIGDRAGALAVYDEALAIRRKLAAADPGNATWQRDVSASLNNIADMRLASGDRPGALAAYEEALTIRRKLAASDPGNAGWQRDVATNLDNVGNVRLANGNRDTALAAYEEGLAVRRKLVAADPANTGSQRDVSVSLEKVGDVHRAARDHAKALAAYEEGLVIRRKLAGFDAGNTLWQRDMSVLLNRTGDARVAAGNRPGAVADYEESLTIMRRLTAADGGNIGWRVDLVVSMYKVGTNTEPTRAREVLRAALAIIEVLERERKLTPGQQGWRRLLEQALARLPPDRI